MSNDAALAQDKNRLAQLEAEFDAAGGRGVELAEEIDALRRKIRLRGKKFYRTVITVEVLTEEPYNPDSLEQVEYDTMEGEASGDWRITEVEEVDSERMAELLEGQGSDPSFLLGEPDSWDEDE